MRRLVSPGLVVLALAGCASVTPVPTTVVTGGMPNPEEALRQSMQHVDAEMAQLGKMVRPALASRASAGPVVPGDLQRTVNFTYSGQLDQGVSKLALSIGYTFYTTAPPDAPPIHVSVQVQGVTVLETLRALGDQAGTRATVQVDPLHHQVQVIHHV